MLKKGNTIIILNPVFLGALGFLLLLIHSQGKFMGTDEGIWSYMGRIWAENGLVPYSGTINNKPPGIFLMYYLSHLLFGTNIWFPRLLGNLASLGTSLCLYRLVRKLSNRAAAAITMALYISLMPFGIFHGFSTAYTETFVIFFIVLAFMLLTSGSEQTGRWFGLTIFAAGVSAGAALSFKQMAALDILAMLLFAFALLKEEPQRKDVTKAFLLILLGIILATTVGLLVLAANGGEFADYIDQVWMHLFKGREAKIGFAKRLANLIPAWSYKELIIPYLGIAGFLVSIRKLQLKIPPPVLLVWLGLDFMAVNSAGTYYHHQYKQILPSLCIVTGIFLDFLAGKLNSKMQKVSICNNKATIASGIILVILLCYVPFNRGYKRGFEWMFAPRTDSKKELASYVKKITEKDEYIYVYGKGSYQVLSYSGRLAPTAYFIHFFHMYPGALEQVERDFTEKSPVLILIRLKSDLPGWLQKRLDTSYEKLEQRNRFDVFVLKTHAQDMRARIANVSSEK